MALEHLLTFHVPNPSLGTRHGGHDAFQIYQERDVAVRRAVVQLSQLNERIKRLPRERVKHRARGVSLGGVRLEPLARILSKGQVLQKSARRHSTNKNYKKTHTHARARKKEQTRAQSAATFAATPVAGAADVPG